MTILGLLLSTFAGCLAGGLIPVINAEIVVLGAAAVAPAGSLLPIVLAAAGGQMIGKTVLFYAGRGAVRLPIGRAGVLARIDRFTLRWRSAGGPLVFASAAAGLPPFYGMSLACGAAGMGLGAFLLAGFSGRCLRFGIIAFAPQIVRALAG